MDNNLLDELMQDTRSQFGNFRIPFDNGEKPFHIGAFLFLRLDFTTKGSRYLLKLMLLFLCAVRLFSSTRIAKIRNQSDRNIRKVRGTMLKKIRKKLLPALLDKAEKQQPMTLLEKDFLEENMAEIDSEEKK